MKKFFNFCIVCFLFLSFVSPEKVLSEEVEDHTYYVTENIKHIGEYLKRQDYFSNVSKLCHEEECFAIDINDLNRSIQVMEQKILNQIRTKYGEDVYTEALLKGISITKILTH